MALDSATDLAPASASTASMTTKAAANCHSAGARPEPPIKRFATVPGEMLRLVRFSLIVVAVAFTAPAAAAPGNGLYEPFPTPTAHSTDHYYAKLGLRLTAAEVRRGAFGRGLRAVPPSAPSVRAGVGAGTPGLPLLLLAFAAAVGVVAIPRLLTRRITTTPESHA